MSDAELNGGYGRGMGGDHAEAAVSAGVRGRVRVREFGLMCEACQRSRRVDCSCFALTTGTGQWRVLSRVTVMQSVDGEEIWL